MERPFRLKFRNIIVISFISLLIITNVTFVWLFSGFFKNLITNNIKESAMSNAVKMIEVLNIKLQNQYQISRAIIRNATIKEIVSQKPTSLFTQVTYNREVTGILFDYFGDLGDISSINVYTKNYAQPINDIMERKYDDVVGFGLSNYKVFEKYVMNNNMLYKFNNDIFFSLYVNRGLDVPMLMSLQWIKDKKDEQLGVLAIFTRMNYLFESLETMKSNENASIYIIDYNGNTIYHPDFARISHKFTDFSFVKEILKRKDGNFIRRIKGKERIVTFKSFAKMNWILVEVTSYQDLLKSFNTVTKTIIILSLLIIVFISLVSLVLSNQMTGGLRKLMKNIKRIQTGELATDLGSSKIVEIDDLNKNFASMIDRINGLVSEMEIVNKKERDAELKALQAQINPHFLYNTLDAVYWMTDNQDAASIIENLGKFFRLSLSKGKEFVCVGDEILHVRKYVEIEMKIYKNRFEFIEETQEEVHQYQMVKLVLQPLIENAIMHGFKLMKSGGVIKLSARKVGNDLEFTVEDNGSGVDLEAINQVLTSKEETKWYGIKNVNERIQLKYGKVYGLFYGNRSEGGTIVKVIVPAVEG